RYVLPSRRRPRSFSAPALARLPLATARALLPPLRRGLLVARACFRMARSARAFAHALENLDQAEIDLPHFHVDANHLHPHLVAEAVDLVRILAAEHVRSLDESIVVVRHRRHVHHALDEMLDELDEQPERRDAGDVAVELVADLVGHELDLLP